MIQESRIGQAEPAIVRNEVAYTGEYGNAYYVRQRYTLSDGAITEATVIRPNRDALFGLRIDPTFLDQPIELDNSRLISQGTTTEAWGQIPGQKPEEFIALESMPTVALAPTNAGWQRDAFWVKRGQPLLLPNDEGEITGKFTVLGSKDRRWSSTDVSFKNGLLDEESQQAIAGVNIGFDVPLLVRDGRKVPLAEIIGHPRLLADARNVFNFGPKEGLPGDFWKLIRPLLAETQGATSRLQKGGVLVTSAEMPEDETDQLAEIIQEAGLEDTFLLRRNPLKPTRTQLAITKPLPLNRIPMFGIGHDIDGGLVIAAIDGRQKNSAGATLDEAAEIMLHNGMVNGGLGSAGGDVAVVTNEGTFLNSLSTTDTKGNVATRPVPSVLTIR